MRTAKHCDGLSILYLLRAKGENVYQGVSEIYDRRRPLRKKDVSIFGVGVKSNIKIE